jgi:hypothetical protein
MRRLSGTRLDRYLAPFKVTHGEETPRESHRIVRTKQI